MWIRNPAGGRMFLHFAGIPEEKWRPKYELANKIVFAREDRAYLLKHNLSHKLFPDGDVRLCSAWSVMSADFAPVTRILRPVLASGSRVKRRACMNLLLLKMTRIGGHCIMPQSNNATSAWRQRRQRRQKSNARRRTSLLAVV